MKLWVWMLAAPLAAHTVSISTGALEIEGNVATYTVVLPTHDVDHMLEARAEGLEPERVILGSISLSGASMSDRRCTAESQGYVCRSKFSYNTAPEEVTVSVRLHEAIASNHVHVLHARRGERTSQAVFDGATPVRTLVFRRSGTIETALRARPSMVLVLGLITIVLACAGLSFVSAAAAFAAGFAACFALPTVLTPRFAESVVALLAAYTAFETLYLPAAKGRALVIAILGSAAGLYFRVLMPGAGAPAGAVFCAMLAGLALQRSEAAQRVLKPALLWLSLAWFVILLV